MFLGRIYTKRCRIQFVVQDFLSAPKYFIKILSHMLHLPNVVIPAARILHSPCSDFDKMSIPCAALFRITCFF